MTEETKFESYVELGSLSATGQSLLEWIKTKDGQRWVNAISDEVSAMAAEQTRQVMLIRALYGEGTVREYSVALPAIHEVLVKQYT